MFSTDQAYSHKILTFFKSLRIEAALPRGVKVLNPYLNENAFSLCEKFYSKYYNDSMPRKIILGINPGRLGSGLTGIPFTDPVHLEQHCNISNNYPKKQELSSTFIHEMMLAMGGLTKFYQSYYFSSVSPLGFIKQDKNLNYYDLPLLEARLKPFIISCLHTQISFGIDTHTAYCLGEGDNFAYLNKLNDEHLFFDKIIPLAHPRFIMQYKRKLKEKYIEQYKEVLSS
jgi:hypothetical protein